MRGLARDRGAELLDRPLGTRMCCDVPVHDPAHADLQHDEHVEDAEAHGDGHEEVARQHGCAWLRPNVSLEWSASERCPRGADSADRRNTASTCSRRRESPWSSGTLGTRREAPGCAEEPPPAQSNQSCSNGVFNSEQGPRIIDAVLLGRKPARRRHSPLHMAPHSTTSPFFWSAPLIQTVSY